MHLTHDTLKPVPPAPPTAHSAREARTHQGIPGIVKLPSGRLLATWYAGGTTECRENYVLLVYSDDDAMTWHEAQAVIDPPHPDVRAFDAGLWIAPTGKVYWFWAQGCGGDDGVTGQVDEVFDGLVGVWLSEIETPDAAAGAFHFGAPRRIADGIMLNKPTVLSDGTWAMPCSLWSVKSAHRAFHEALHPVYGAQMVVSTDQGESFSLRGAVDIHSLGIPPSFDEHIFLERRDGTIACYVRCNAEGGGIARSISRDGGVTWSRLELQPLPGKDTRFYIGRLASGRVLMVANDSRCARERMTAFLSEDDGESWPYKLLLDERRGVSYPDAFQDAGGNLYIAYDYKRTEGGFLYICRITEEDIIAGKIGPESFVRREVDHSRPTSLVPFIPSSP